MNAATPDVAATGAPLPDSVSGHPLLRLAPAWARPYVLLARLDRPVGWRLLLAPCWQSSALAAAVQGQGPYYLHLALFLIGAVVMRGAGCAYNDIVDREIDAKVERTRGRPLPSGQIRVRDAKIFVALLCLAGLAVLLCFNAFAIALGLSSILVVLAYPFMKRVTSWPQAVLGLAFSWGALMGWAAVFGALAAPPVLLFFSGVLWTIGYDTIYAFQDTRDDAVAGVKSTARLFGDRARAAIGALYAGALLLAGAALWTAGVGLPAWLGLAAFGAHLGWQVVTLDPADPARALKLFRANSHAGFLLFAGLFAAALTG